MALSNDNAVTDAAELHRAEAIFHEALDLPADQRPALLESRCAGDTALMAELRSLLRACEEEELLGSRLATTAHAQSRSVTRPRLIGHYELERVLGRGGMGAVYLARRADGHFDQQVAVKLIDLPLATDLFRERFRLERQILAGLVHPYIARLLDGGVSDEGDLYLAMEYVDGVSITRYCEENSLSLSDRLELFHKVCSAVQFAHQNLVVHRDLKPDNILVARDGTPRLLDFGTAKLISPMAEDAATGFTQHGLQAFTPQYASPEQVLGDPITTASDTYSLGVLLYVLLAGIPPYQLKEFTTAEMLRVVCTDVPPKASAAASPHAPYKIDHDLDAIVGKALRKESRERYLTVDQFAADIQAWLSGRPVQARRGTVRYRAEKFVRRHKLPILAACVFCLSVLAGIAGVLWQSRAANLQRRHAEARSQDLRQLSNSLLSEIDEAVKELPGSTPVQHLLVQRVLEHLDRMSQDAAGDRLTQLDLVDAYTRLASLQGNPYDQNIGDTAGALVSIDKALAIASALHAAAPNDSVVLGPLALAQQSRSEILYGMSRTPESVAQFREAIKTFDARAASPRATAPEIADAATAWGGLGDQLGQTGTNSLEDTAAALDAYRKALALTQRALAIAPGYAKSKRSFAVMLMKIGNMVNETDPNGAVGYYHQSLAAWNAMSPADKSGVAYQRGVAYAYRKLGLSLTDSRNYPTAIDAYERALAVQEKYAVADPKDTRAQYDLAVTLSNEMLTYVDMLDPRLTGDRRHDDTVRAQAIALLQRIIASLQSLVAVEPGSTAWTTYLAYHHVVLGTLESATSGSVKSQKASAQAIELLRREATKQDATSTTLDTAVTAMLTVRPEKLRDAAWTLSIAEKLVADTHRKKIDFLRNLAEAYDQAGRLREAGLTAHEALALLPPADPRLPATRNRTLLLIEAARGEVPSIKLVARR